MSETVAPAQLIETTPTPPPADTPVDAQPSRARDETGKFAPKAPAETTLLATEPAAPPAPVVPEKYEFTAPEVDGKPVAVDPEALGGFETTAREAGLTQEQFAKLAPWGVQLIEQQVAKGLAQVKALAQHMQPETQRAWVDAIKSDAEIGGDKLAPALAQAAKVIEQYGGAELKEALTLTRAGNHPAIVKAFVAIGKAMGDAESLITGKPANQKTVSPEAHARAFYNERGGNYAPMEG